MYGIKALATCMLLLPLMACGRQEQEPAATAQPSLEQGAADVAGAPVEARTVLRNQDGQEVGEAIITQNGEGVVVAINARNLPPGERGLHIHEIGQCDPPAHQGAGSHFNPEARAQHGLDSPEGGHAGDMRNVEVRSDGTVQATLPNDQVTLRPGVPNSLLDADGSTVILHENRDDHTPDAVTGARIACGVITAS